MAAATTSIATSGRTAVYADVSAVLVTITATATAYATATGGLPIDLAGVLNDLAGAAPFSQPYINPADVVCLIPIGTALGAQANHFLPADLVVNVAGATYTNPANWPFAGGSATSIQPDKQLLTCPATFRLWNGATEQADANVTTVVSFLLYVARGGTNS